MNRTLSVLFAGTLLGAVPANYAPLKEGDSIPDVTLRTQADQEVSLRKLVARKPTVLVFYRGGWCPFCTRHLGDLAGIEPDLEKAGAQLLAISMDQPAKLRETPNRDQLGYLPERGAQHGDRPAALGGAGARGTVEGQPGRVVEVHRSGNAGNVATGPACGSDGGSVQRHGADGLPGAQRDDGHGETPRRGLRLGDADWR